MCLRRARVKRGALRPLAIRNGRKPSGGRRNLVEQYVGEDGAAKNRDG